MQAKAMTRKEAMGGQSHTAQLMCWRKDCRAGMPEFKKNLACGNHLRRLASVFPSAFEKHEDWLKPEHPGTQQDVLGMPSS
jgi:hypothetical protein